MNSPCVLLAAKLRGSKKYLLPLLAAALAVPFLPFQKEGKPSQASPPRSSDAVGTAFTGKLRTPSMDGEAFRAVTGTAAEEKISVWQAFQKAAHEIQLADAAAAARPENAGVRFFASNPGQQITARFLDEGVRLQSGAGGVWQAAVHAVAAGRGGSMTELPAKAGPTAQGDTVSYERGGVVEWFANKPEGIEQGFTIASPPEGAAGQELRVDVSVQGLSARNEGGGIALHDAQGGKVLGYDKLKVWDANGTELPARMTGQGDRISILVADAGAVYPVTIDPVFTSYEGKLEIGELVCGRPGDYLGHAVGVFGDLAAVGAPGDDSLLGTDVGAAYVFERIEGVWTLAAKLKATDGANGDRMGAALAVGDGVVLVGARLADLKNKENAGAVYAFSKRLGMWMQTSKLTAKDSTAGAWFGESIAVDGGTAVIGAPSHLSNRGAAYVFTRKGASWQQAERLLATGGAPGDRFGEAVDVKGDRKSVV